MIFYSNTINYNKFIEKINLVVQKTLRKKVIPKDYMISYKAVNAADHQMNLKMNQIFKNLLVSIKG